MKSKIFYSLFILLVFLFGLSVGFYGGVINTSSPVISQLWAGAKEMQAAIFLIDKKESTKARNLLCNSIQTRLTIMESLQPIKNEATSNSHKEFENYLYEDIKRDKPKFHAICI